MDKLRENRILAFENIARRYHRDEDYRQKLEADPAGVLAEAGIEIPQDVEVRVVIDKPGLRHFLIPEVPPSGNVSESELDEVSGGLPADYDRDPAPSTHLGGQSLSDILQNETQTTGRKRRP